MSSYAAQLRPLDIQPDADQFARSERRAQRRARGRVRVAVVGGGVAGISAARELRALGVEVVVIEHRDVDHTVSWIAAGLIEPVAGTRDPAGTARELEAFMRSMHMWRALDQRGSTLISRRRVVTVSAGSRSPLPWANAVENFRPISAASVHQRYAEGEAATFSTYVVEAPRWLLAARARLAWGGVSYVRRRLDELAEVLAVVGPVDGIVNASGLGAAALAGDPTLYRGDGHLIRVLPIPGLCDVLMDETRAPEEVSADPLAVNMLYVIPRRHDIVIGGTLWDRHDVTGTPQPLAGMPEHLLRLAAQVEPRLAQARIVGYHVGARPRRSAGVRVELDASGPVPVVHCYGQGGSGWTLAPALAEDAVGLLADATWGAQYAA